MFLISVSLDCFTNSLSLGLRLFKHSLALGGSCITIKLENPGPGINVPLKPQGQKIEYSCAEERKKEKKKEAERWFQATGILTNFPRSLGLWFLGDGRQGAASEEGQDFLRAVLLLGGVQAALFLIVLCSGCGPPSRGLGFLGHFVRHHDSTGLTCSSQVNSELKCSPSPPSRVPSAPVAMKLRCPV